MEDGRRLLKQFFDDNPTRKLWVPRILDDKGKVNKTGEGLAHETNYQTGEVYLAYNLRISYNHKKYFDYYAPRLVTLLDKIAHKAIKVETSCKTEPRGKLFGKGEAFTTNCEEAVKNVGKVGTDFFAVRVLVQRSKNKKTLFFRSFILKRHEYQDLFDGYMKANKGLIWEVKLTGEANTRLSGDWKISFGENPYSESHLDANEEVFRSLGVDERAEGIKASKASASPRLTGTKFFEYGHSRTATGFSVIKTIQRNNYSSVSNIWFSPFVRLKGNHYEDYGPAWAEGGVHRRDVILTADELKSLKTIKARILSPSDVGL